MLREQACRFETAADAERLDRDAKTLIHGMGRDIELARDVLRRHVEKHAPQARALTLCQSGDWVVDHEAPSSVSARLKQYT
jgi:hypothetical protein